MHNNFGLEYHDKMVYNILLTLNITQKWLFCIENVRRILPYYSEKSETSKIIHYCDLFWNVLLKGDVNLYNDLQIRYASNYDLIPLAATCRKIENEPRETDKQAILDMMCQTIITSLSLKHVERALDRVVTNVPQVAIFHYRMKLNYRLDVTYKDQEMLISMAKWQLNTARSIISSSDDETDVAKR